MTPALHANSQSSLLSPGALARLEDQSREMEGVFLNTLMKEMFASVSAQGEIDGGFAEETWRGMQAEQMASAVAEAGGIGLAEAILPELIAAQEAAASSDKQVQYSRPYSTDADSPNTSANTYFGAFR